MSEIDFFDRGRDFTVFLWFLLTLTLKVLEITLKLLEITFWIGKLLYVIKNVSITFDLKKYIRKRPQICDRCSFECFAMLNRFHSRGRTDNAGSVTQIAFKYKLNGYSNKLFQKWFRCPLFCVCLFLTVDQSAVATQQHKHRFSEISANSCFQFWLLGPSLCAIVDFLVLEVFNSNILLSEAIVGLKLFYLKSFQKQFCAFINVRNFI